MNDSNLRISFHHAVTSSRRHVVTSSRRHAVTSSRRHSLIIHITLLLISLNQTFQLSGQENFTERFERITSENYKLEKGLSQNTIHCMMQDRVGFLWFGTWDGLNKYDGYNFTIYRPEPQRKNQTLSDKTILCIYESKDGLIWIGTQHGLNLLNRRTGEIKTIYKSPDANSGLSSDTIYCMVEDFSGRLWLGTQNGLNLYNPKTSRFTAWLKSTSAYHSVSNNIIHQIVADRQGLWIATEGGLNRLDFSTNRYQYFVHREGDINSLSCDTVNCLYPGMKGQLWLGTSNGLNNYDPFTGKFRSFHHISNNISSLSNNFINSILEDKKGNLWVGTQGGGLELYDRNTDQFIHYQHSTSDPASVSNDFITCLLEDRSGVIWVGTSWNGVNKLLRDSRRFNHIYPISNDNNNLNSNLIWSFMGYSPDELWIGTSNGINVYNRKSGKYKYITSEKGKKNALSSNHIRWMFKDKRNTVWVGTENDGINLLEPDNGKILYYRHNDRDPGSLASDKITSIIEDKEGSVWVSTRGGGLDKFDAALKKFIHYQSIPNDTNTLASNVVWSVYFDRRNRLWACTEEGLSVYDAINKRFRTFRHDPDNREGISINDVFSIYEDQKGVFWVATSGGGLCRLNAETGRFKTYTEQNGLANNVVYNILPDDRGNLWMSTNFGLSCFDPENEIFYNYDVKDGVQSNEFNFGAALKTTKGELLFGGMNGFNAFDPGNIKRNFIKPPVLVTSLKLMNEIFHGEFKSGDTIFLKHNQNFFSLEFAALDFSNPLKNKYRYILEGLGAGWTNADANHHFAEYTKVSPGVYVFRLLGSNNDGVWNDKEFRLTIIIDRPWYKTWLFRIVSVLFLVAVIMLVVNRRIRKLKQKHEVEKKFLTLENQILDIEKKALRLQMNPHFIFNAMNSIQSFILAKDTDQAINYLSKFSHLMRLILANSREAFIPLGNELKAIRFYLDLERLRFEKKFIYELDIDGIDDPENIEIPPMLIQPYIENAIIHGLVHKKGTGKIVIKVSMQNDLLHISIEDDGIGREKAQEILEASGIKRQSQGMFITAKRLELLRKSQSDKFAVTIIDLKDEQGHACGTRVELDIVPRIRDIKNQIT